MNAYRAYMDKWLNSYQKPPVSSLTQARRGMLRTDPVTRYSHLKRCFLQSFDEEMKEEEEDDAIAAVGERDEDRDVELPEE